MLGQLYIHEAHSLAVGVGAHPHSFMAPGGDYREVAVGTDTSTCGGDGKLRSERDPSHDGVLLGCESSEDGVFEYGVITGAFDLVDLALLESIDLHIRLSQRRLCCSGKGRVCSLAAPSETVRAEIPVTVLRMIGIKICLGASRDVDLVDLVVALMAFHLGGAVGKIVFCGRERFLIAGREVGNRRVLQCSFLLIRTLDVCVTVLLIICDFLLCFQLAIKIFFRDWVSRWVLNRGNRQSFVHWCFICAA